MSRTVKKKKKKEPLGFQVSCIYVLASPFRCQTKESCAQILIHMPVMAKHTDARLLRCNFGTDRNPRSHFLLPLSSLHLNVSSQRPESRRAENDSSALIPAFLSVSLAAVKCRTLLSDHRKPNRQISQMKLKAHLMFDISVADAMSVISSSWMRADTNRLEHDVLMCA